MELNNTQSRSRLDRRGWLISGCRLIVLGAIAGFSGSLWLKSQKLRCAGQAPCGQCPRWNSCPFTEAAQSRRNEKGFSS